MSNALNHNAKAVFFDEGQMQYEDVMQTMIVHHSVPLFTYNLIPIVLRWIHTRVNGKVHG